MIDLARTIADPTKYGWKAHYLSLMLQWGLNVPQATALSTDEASNSYTAANELEHVAVRSSGVGEDSSRGSMAGSFASFLDIRGTDATRTAIEAVRASGHGCMPMGVVVQAMARMPVVSGVAFSCDPVTLNVDRFAISWSEGYGDGLAAGSVAGADLQVDAKSAMPITGNWPLSQRSLTDLVGLVGLLATKLGRPVDVEWCIQEGAMDVSLLQVRPLVLPEPAVVDLVTTSDFAALPGQVLEHSKMRLRREAAGLGIPMSPARAIVATGVGGLPNVPAFPVSRDSAGRSVVLIHPNKVEGKIIREFAQDCSTDVEFFTRGCQRYSIRQYPTSRDAGRTVFETLRLGLQSGPLACAIEQEVLHAYATGIVRGTSTGYLIEVALGHFVPKGYVETSSFLLDESGRVILENRAPQTKAYHFINGHVVTEEPPYEDLALTPGDLRSIVKVLRPLILKRPDAAFEFGLLGRPGSLSAYMIDVADADDSADAMTQGTIERGIVSPGVARGRVVDLRNAQVLDDLNAHLLQGHDEDSAEELEPAIYIARSASVDLLPLVRQCGTGSGFVFERAALLAHVSVILRERGLAAVLMSPQQIDNLLANGAMQFDTATHSRSSEDVSEDHA